MLSYLLTAVLLAGAPSGQLTIKTGDLQVLMSSKVGWTISALDFQGEKMILPLGGQGAIFNAGGKWVGAGSGAEETEKVSAFDIKASNLETDAKGDASASGEQVSVHKESTILAIKHTADTTFSAGRVVQRHQFEATEDLDAANFDAFIYSLSPKAKNWLAQPLAGPVLRGEFNADQANKPDEPVRWMAQYDPAIQKGILLYYQQPMSGNGAYNSFWDTNSYHKAFAQPLKGLIAKGTKLDLTLVLQFFACPPEAWEPRAQELAADLQTQFPQQVTVAPPAPRIYDEGVPEDGFVTFKTDHYTVPLCARQAWTIYQIDFDGQTISHHQGFYGTVMIPKGSNFWGTGHTEGGREIVHSVTVKVDGTPDTPVGQAMLGKTLSGHKLTFLKHSTIWKFDCTQEVTVTDDQVFERTTLEAQEPTELTTLYYFMHCFQPTSTKWLAEMPDGTFEQGDLLSDGKMKISKDTRWVAQYDPTTSLGLLCYTPKVIAGPGSASLIWDLDAKRYHKYYLRYTTGASFKPGDKLDYSVIVKAVPNEKEDFAATKAVAAELEKQYPPVN